MSRVPRRLRGRGYSMVALVIAIVVMNIAVAAVLPLWSTVIRRSEEQELIFRGIQYAEAIRVFEARFGRPPTSLDELLELKPRSIRQLWTDPLSESGAWVPLMAEAGSKLEGAEGSTPDQGQDLTGRAGSSDFGQDDDEEPADDDDGFDSFSSFGDDLEETQIGPIEGVRPTAAGAAKRSFFGRESYESWEFRAQMLPAPSVGADGLPRLPNVDSASLGRAFPEWLEVAGGQPNAPKPGSTNPLDEPEGRAGDPEGRQ